MSIFFFGCSTLQDDKHWRRQLVYGALGHVPFDVQVVNVSGGSRAAQTLTFDSVWLPIQYKASIAYISSAVTVCSSCTAAAIDARYCYRITQCYLPPDTGERAPPQPQPDRPVLDLPTAEGWKAELTLVIGYIARWFV